MKKLIRPSTISGRVKAPASKSMMQRAVAAAVLSGTTLKICNPSLCSDSLSALSVAERLGFRVSKNAEEITLTKESNTIDTTLDCGESGLCIRMFSSIAALYDETITLTGNKTLLKRPVNMILDALVELGVTCETDKGHPPIKIKGPINGRNVHVDGSVSSQFLTGLLMALPTTKDDTIVYVDNLKSKPYIDMTIDLLKDFSVDIQNEDYRLFKIKGGQKYNATEYAVEGDWSSAAFLLVAGAIAGEAHVTGLNLASKQADKTILDALKLAGANVEIKGDSVKIVKSELKAFEFDATDSPDLFPPLVALACNAEGLSVISGVGRLIHKESNRAMALTSEFSKIGANINISEDKMEIMGTKLTGGRVNSHGDHRIAMSTAVAALTSENGVQIDGWESVDKSYPNFFNDLSDLGGTIDE